MERGRAGREGWVTRTLGRAERRIAARLLALGMSGNPLHVVACGRDPRMRERCLGRFFNALLPFVERHGTLRGAFADGELVAVLGILPPGACRPTAVERVRMALRVALGCPPTAAWRIARWLLDWQRRHPRSPHWHLGPLAVHPGWRRRGIASALLREHCRVADASGAPSWLETDLEANVELYRRFGFRVVAERPVLGVRNWFMARPAG